MHLARHHISETAPTQLLDARFDVDSNIFTICTPAGFAVYQTSPLKLLRKRELKNGTLGAVLPLHTSSLLFLVGGGNSPRYPLNKVILWDDARGKEVAELEFKERVRGVACRRGCLVIALRRRVVVFDVTDTIERRGEWPTCENERGLVAIATAPHSTLLAVPGRQMGHVQIIRLPPCPLPSQRDPRVPPPAPPPHSTKHAVSIIAAHHAALTALSVTPSGRLIATTSERGTLVRVWDASSGKLVRELRRGSDQADIYGVAFRSDESEVCVWSDKGTVHVFDLAVGSTNRQSTLSQLSPFIPLPKYFESEWSYAHYRIPMPVAHVSLSPSPRTSQDGNPVDEEKCVVAWIQYPISTDAPDASRESKYEHQLIALTYTGGWYRLSLPSFAQQDSEHVSSSQRSSSPRSPRASEQRTRTTSQSSRSSDKGKHGEKESEKKRRDCTLQEFRRFGRWDGWT